MIFRKFRKHEGKAESLTENMFSCLLVFDSKAEEDQELVDQRQEGHCGRKVFFGRDTNYFGEILIPGVTLNPWNMKLEQLKYM